MNTFAPNSRYGTTGIAILIAPDGREISYLQRRFVPQPHRFATIDEHVVRRGERMDQIAWQYLGDAEQFWRICDANAAMHPDWMTETPGRRLRITLPEGVPGSPYA